MISPVTNRVPYASSIISNCKESTWKLDNLIVGYNFVLILNEYVYSVKNIGGIDGDILNDPLTEGGNEWPIFTRNYTNSSFIKISLERAMPIRKSQIASSAIRAAVAAAAKMCGGVTQNIVRRAALLAAAALDPIATLENGPAIGIIQVFDRTFTKDVANFKFFSYGAERWSLSGLDATSEEIVFETIELVCSDLTRMTSDWSKGPSGIWNKDSDGSMYDEEEMKTLEKFRNYIAKKQEERKAKYPQTEYTIENQLKKLQENYEKLTDDIDDDDEKKDSQGPKELDESRERIKEFNEDIKNKKEESEKRLKEIKEEAEKAKKEYEDILEKTKTEREQQSAKDLEELKNSRERVKQFNEKIKQEKKESEERLKEAERKKAEYEKMKSDLLKKEKEKNKDKIYDDVKSEEIAREKEEKEKQEKQEKEKQEMKKKAAEEVKNEIDRLERLKNWKDSQKT